MGGCFSSPQTGPQAVAQAVPPSAPQAAPPPSDPVSQGLGDAQQAIGLIDGIYRIVEPAILEASHKRNEKNSLKKFLGPWWGEAFEYGACMVPVLDIEELENHLQTTNAVLEPRGNCTADSQWGYLLHALAINPGDQTLTWKPASGALWDMPEGTLAMDVRGKVFCHLVNLYNMDPQARRKLQLRARVNTHEGHMVAKFEPDTIRKLNGRKEPRGIMGLQLVDAVWTAYKDALEHGISDPTMVWPDPNATPFAQRLACLITNMPRLRDKDPRILTGAWVESASRIKMRAMSNGGTDETFLEDVYKTLAEHPSRRIVTNSGIKDLQTSLRSCFFFEDDRFVLIDQYTITDTPSQTLGPGISRVDILERTLEAYTTEDPQSWKGHLYASKDLVLKVALMDTKQRCSAAVNELAFGPGDPLWNTRVHL